MAHPYDLPDGAQCRSLGGAENRATGSTSQRLVGLIVANGGSITFDQVTETLWAGADVARSRAPLRRVLWRLQRAVGEPVFADFQYDEWVLATLRRVDRTRISLLDLLSTAAEDSGDPGSPDSASACGMHRPLSDASAVRC